MSNDWILDVIADLRTFASDNGMPALAHGLDDLAQVAAREVARSRLEALQVLEFEAGHAGELYRNDGARRNAR